nr:BTAD domain-containing putative transcriptional regulator [Haloechinothrix aidingensis]
MRLRVLGSLEADREGTAVALGSSRQRALLAALLVDAGRVVPVETLAAALWGDHQPADPRNAIQTYVARLREALGSEVRLVTRSPGYALHVEPDQVDALRFERLLARAQKQRAQPPLARELLDEALGLWRGTAYSEFAGGFARGESLRLAERRLVAIEERAEARIALGEPREAVAELEALLVEHPLRERFVELLMRALATVDRQAEALATYRGYRERLADETGLDPSPSLDDLHGRIMRGELAGSAAGPAARQEPDTRRPVAEAAPAVPVATTSLVGREHEIAEARTALDRHPVVTLTGPGGVGKTRVAAEVAGAVHSEARYEVAWVELAPVSDPAALDHVLASATGVDVSAGPSPRAALLRALAARTLVLVLDNCEHLLDAIASVVDKVQQRCPRVRVLATSRERLAIEGEQVQPIAPLSTRTATGGADRADSVRLFLDRAASVTGGSDLSDRLPAVREICLQLDGLPLAIELAAARTASLPVEDLCAALRDGASATVGYRRSEPGRHRTVGTVVEWSYQLLDAGEQRLFERLSVFAGAFTLDQAHAVSGADVQSRTVTVEQVAALVERSLLSHAEPAGGDHRYRMLRPVRRFARERLVEHGGLETTLDRHAAVLTEYAERAAGPPMTDEGRRRLDASLDDLREVRRRAWGTGDLALLGRLVAALYRYSYWRTVAELGVWADEALTMAGADKEPTAPQMHAAAAAAAWMRGDLERAQRLATRGAGLGAGPDDPARTLAYEALGDAVFFEGRLPEAEAAFGEVVRLSTLSGDPDGETLGRTSVAIVLACMGRVPDAVREADAAGRAATRAGPTAQAFARYTQGECRAETAPGDAMALADEAAALAHDCQAWFVEGVARLTAASLRGRHGEPARAVPAYADLLRHWRRSGHWTQQWTTLRNFVELLVRLAADEPALVIAGAEAHETAKPSFGVEFDRLSEALSTARARLGEQRSEEAFRRGQRMDRDDVVDFALDTCAELSGR